MHLNNRFTFGRVIKKRAYHYCGKLTLTPTEGKSGFKDTSRGHFQSARKVVSPQTAPPPLNHVIQPPLRKLGERSPSSATRLDTEEKLETTLTTPPIHTYQRTRGAASTLEIHNFSKIVLCF